MYELVAVTTILANLCSRARKRQQHAQERETSGQEICAFCIFSNLRGLCPAVSCHSASRVVMFASVLCNCCLCCDRLCTHAVQFLFLTKFGVVFVPWEPVVILPDKSLT